MLKAINGNMSPSSFPSSSNREFHFNRSTKFSFFLEEDGIYEYRFQASLKTMIPFVISGAIILSLDSIMLDFLGLISINEYGYLAVIAAIVACVPIAVLQIKAEKMPSGSSKAEWEQSNAMETSYNWSQVKQTKVTGLKGGKGVLLISLGSGKRFLSVRDEAQYQELRTFLSEKIGDKLTS